MIHKQMYKKYLIDDYEKLEKEVAELKRLIKWYVEHVESFDGQDSLYIGEVGDGKKGYTDLEKDYAQKIKEIIGRNYK